MEAAPRIYPVTDLVPAHEYAVESTLPTDHSPDAHPILPRGRSFSLPWRSRPKSMLLSLTENTMRQDFNLSNSDATDHRQHDKGAIRNIVRRASASLRGFVSRDYHLGRRGSDDSGADYTRYSHRHAHGGPIESRPSTSWQRLRQRASFIHQPRDLSQTMLNFDATPPPIFPVPGNGAEPPIIPIHTGKAAKAAAAAAHSEYFVTNAGKKFLLEDSDVTGDRESGIGINMTASEADTDTEETNHDIAKVDFISTLPVELALQVLSLLNIDSLLVSTNVSRTWNFVVRNQHVWRESFLREKATAFAIGKPSPLPGVGLGIPPVQPHSNWKQIYQVRERLEKNWRKGKLVPTHLLGHEDSIYCVQFDESKIITGSRDKTIRIWDMHTFECRLVIGPPDVVNQNSIFFNADNKPAHCAQREGVEFSVSMPATVSFPIHHRASVLCLQYDNRILVTGSSDATCIVHNVRSGYRPIRRLVHHEAAVLDVVFDEKHIVTGSKDISVCVWDRETGCLLKQLRGHAGPVNAVQLRGNSIVSCSGDFLVKLWNIDTGTVVREFTGHTKGLACSQFSEDGKYIASAGNDRTIRVWDANTGECLQEMDAHKNLVRSLHIDSISGRLISASYDQDIKVWDIATGRLLLDFPSWHVSWVLAARSDYRRIVSTGQEPKILIMDFGAEIPGIEMLESVSPSGLDMSEHLLNFI